MGVDVYSTYQVQIRPGNPQDTPTFCKFQSQQSDIFQTDKHNVKEKVKSKNLDLAGVFEKLCCQIYIRVRKIINQHERFIFLQRRSQIPLPFNTFRLVRTMFSNLVNKNVFCLRAKCWECFRSKIVVVEIS